MPKTTTKSNADRAAIVFIPLDQLSIAETNVRKTYSKASIRQMAESIASVGKIQQPLIATRKGRKDFGVHAGGRRCLGAGLLLEEGRLPAALADGLPVIVTKDDRAAQLQASIIENVERENLTPIEEFQAFNRLADEGLDVTAIANRFGISETKVKQRLALANVHPTIVEAFEKNEINLQVLQSFTIEPNQERQLKCFNDLPSYNLHPSTVRRFLTQAEIPASDMAAKFVGLTAYEEAGGRVKRDLFDDSQVTLLDRKILDDLAAQKLEACVGEIAEEGWRWVEPMVPYDSTVIQGFGRVYPEPRDLSEDEVTEAKALDGRISDLADRMDELAAIPDPSDEVESEYEGLETELKTLQAQRQHLKRCVFSEEQLGQAGAVLYFDHTGLRVERGLVRPEDQGNQDDAPSPAEPSAAGTGGSVEADPSKAVLASDAVTGALNTALEAAMQHAISNNCKVAFLVSTAFLVEMVFGDRGKTHALQYANRQRFTVSAEFDVATAGANAEAFDQWDARLAEETGDMVSILAGWPPSDVEALHAFCAGALYSRSALHNLKTADNAHCQLRALLNFDPTATLRADAALFGRLTKVQIGTCLKDMGPDDDHSLNVGKAELVAAAVKRAAAQNWLPALLRDDLAGRRLVAERPLDLDAAEHLAAE